MRDQFFQAIKTLKNNIIRYPQFEFAYQEIQNNLQLKQQTGIAQHLSCFSPSGTGKTTLKREIEKAYPRSIQNQRFLIPVLTVDTPAIPSVPNIAETMLISLGDPASDKGSVAQKTMRILHFLKECNVQMIIFDELQHFIDQGRRNAPFQVSDWLKDLVDQANIPTVLMGLERSEQILKINEQLRRRFNRQISLPAFDITQEYGFQIFAGVIIKLQELLNFPIEFDLTNSKNVERIYFATNGIIDYIVKLLLCSYQITLQDGKEAITQASLYKAFIVSIWRDASDDLNPFHTSFTSQPLTKLNMPFHVATGYRNDK